MDFTTYLQTNARKLDLRLYEHIFENTPAQPVLDELANYQNPDGGFGHSLEPDVTLPESSVIATTVAFQYLTKIHATDGQLVAEALQYLLANYDKTKQRWVNIPSAADNYPRAPWWNYEQIVQSGEWGNPSAEILGYLLQHADKVDDQALLDKLSKQAVKHLHEITEPEMHEVKCYIRLYELADKKLQGKLHDRLAAQIKQLAATDPKAWGGYVATPLSFVDSPDSPFADLFDKQLLLDNAEYLRGQLVDGNHWEPTWEWGQYVAEWAQAKKDWSGKLTVENLLTLRAFGIQPNS